MKYLIYLIAIILLVGLQIGLFSELRFFSAVPNLLLLLVIGSSLQREDVDAFFIALVSGLFLDYYTGLFIGSFTAAFVISAVVLYGVLHSLVVFDVSIKYLISITIGMTIFVHVFIWALNAFSFRFGLSVASMDAGLLRGPLLGAILYNCLLAYPMYLASTWLKNLTLYVQGKKHRIS